MEEDGQGFSDKSVITMGLIGMMLYRWIILFFTITIYSEVAEDPSKIAMGTFGFLGFFAVIWAGMKETLRDTEKKDDEEEV